MLTSPTILRNRLIALDQTVSLLSGRRVALIGFRDPNQKRVDDNVANLGSLHWPMVDARAAKDLGKALAHHAAAAKLTLLVDATRKLPTDAELLIRAVHDSRDSVRWVDGTESALPAKQVLHVIAAGARSIDDLSRWLARIDFMDFIRPPE